MNCDTVDRKYAQQCTQCRFVRREVRDLSTADSEKFFKAMRRLNTISLEDGRDTYGSSFVNAKIIAAYHASQVMPGSVETPSRPEDTARSYCQMNCICCRFAVGRVSGFRTSSTPFACA